MSQRRIVRRTFKRGTERSMNLRRIEDQTFLGANVQLDGGVSYVRCRFVNCNLVYTGVGPIHAENSSFENCRWSFAGPAGNTFNFLKALYASGQREMIEQLFREIRSGSPDSQANPNPTKSTPVQIIWSLNLFDVQVRRKPGSQMISICSREAIVLSHPNMAQGRVNTFVMRTN
jgi:hypothetical protein